MIYREPSREVQLTILPSEGKLTFVEMNPKPESFLVRYLNLWRAYEALDSIIGPGKYTVEVGLRLGQHSLIPAY